MAGQQAGKLRGPEQEGSQGESTFMEGRRWGQSYRLVVLESGGKAKINYISLWTHTMGSQLKMFRLFIFIWRQE